MRKAASSTECALSTQEVNTHRRRTRLGCRGRHFSTSRHAKHVRSVAKTERILAHRWRRRTRTWQIHESRWLRIAKQAQGRGGISKANWRHSKTAIVHWSGTMETKVLAGLSSRRRDGGRGHFSSRLDGESVTEAASGTIAATLRVKLESTGFADQRLGLSTELQRTWARQKVNRQRFREGIRGLQHDVLLVKLRENTASPEINAHVTSRHAVTTIVTANIDRILMRGDRGSNKLLERMLQ